MATTRYQKLATGVICLGYFVYGIASSLMNTTILDLTEILNTDVQTVSYGLLLRAIFHCVGAALFAWSYSRFNREIQYALSLILFGLGTCFTASSRNMTMFVISNTLVGLATSGIDIPSYVWLFEIYGTKANPYLQAMGGFWAVGQTLAPLITRPYLSSDQSINQTNGDVITQHKKTSIQIPYNVSGVLSIAVGVLVILFTCLFNDLRKSDRKSSASSPSNPEATSKGDNSDSNLKLSAEVHSSSSSVFPISNGKESISNENSFLIPKTLPKAYYIVIIFLAALMMNFQVGLDLDFFNFLHTYAVQGPTKMLKSDASYLVSLTGLVQLASRFVSIFISIYIRPGAIILTSTLITLGSVAILVISGSTVAGLWTGAIILAIGFAPVGSSIYTYLEERTTVTNVVAGILSFSSTILSTSGPYIVGASIETHPFVFILYILVCNVSILIIFILLFTSDLWRSRYLNQLKTKSTTTSRPVSHQPTNCIFNP